MVIRAHLLDIRQSPTPRPVEMVIEDGIIQSIKEVADAPLQYLVPGLVDAHVHIESSMLPPAEFGRWAAAQGTLATVSDPHEIANVLGLEGVRYMVEQAALSPIYHHVGAPSCVPATTFETAGANLGVEETRVMLEDMDLPYLSEMMNWPGVIYGDAEVKAKIGLALALGKPVDGHAPGLWGEQAKDYAAAGISTDHECTSLPEAQEKLDLGMKILIRQGSAARNMEALHPLIASAPGQVMLCTDDCHPDTLLHGHINALVERLLKDGYALEDILESAHYTPKAHYGLPIGSLAVGDAADFIVLDSLESWRPVQVYKGGKLIAENGQPIQEYAAAPTPNYFETRTVSAGDFVLPVFDAAKPYPIILAEDGQLITGLAEVELPRSAEGVPIAVVDSDTLLLAVVNRYDVKASVATALIHGFGLKNGAIASSVAHDSHNVVAVGVSAEALAQAVNAVMAGRGGLAVYDGASTQSLALPIAGLMSDQPGPEVASRYEALEAQARSLGATPKASFMLLSFMALLVIPRLKLSDKGLFDGERFVFWGM